MKRTTKGKAKAPRAKKPEPPKIIVPTRAPGAFEYHPDEMRPLLAQLRLYGLLSPIIIGYDKKGDMWVMKGDEVSDEREIGRAHV